MWHKSEYYYYILYIKTTIRTCGTKRGDKLLYIMMVSDGKDEINKKYFLWAMGCIKWHKSEYYYYILYIKLLYGLMAPKEGTKYENFIIIS